jgi:hypothetical protein
LKDYFRKLSLEDLLAMQAILQKHSPDAVELAESGEIPGGRPSLPVAR